MAFDEGLAERVRQLLEEQRVAPVVEKKMFGGLCFMLDGKMFAGVMKDTLLVRVGAEGHAAALKRPHARPMDFTGKPLKGFVLVAPEGIDLERELEAWLSLALTFVRSARPPAASSGSARRSRAAAPRRASRASRRRP